MQNGDGSRPLDGDSMVGTTVDDKTPALPIRRNTP